MTDQRPDQAAQVPLPELLRPAAETPVANDGSLLLAARISMLVDRHGSLRNVGKLLDIDHAYLYRMQNGEKVNPSGRVLKKLGLERIVTYRISHDPACR